MGHRTTLGCPELHFWLNRSVARAVGVNLSEAMAEGDLTPQGYAEMVTRCRQCHQATACQEWLSQSPSHHTPPAHCLNAGEIARLKH
ncbi:DUF6455 family protein [Thalassobius sp. Cn5-15]|uniref:DUF6455 family protein n=1 Tax=Thalassobius sp. Cn5-15 TaxID=2917763 RepID=UPI001EF21150|nr:DUF6455 family protein [Thalassobius sp. Cn5-15]MCG7493735.1 DUF6455 family protein [Thalassobius sp. Cn5-15]